VAALHLDLRRRVFLAGALAAAGVALSGCVLPQPSIYMAGDDAAIRRRFAGTPITVIRRGDAVILRMPTDVTFETNSTVIAESFAPMLAAMADVIAEHPQAKVRVTGHADAVGTDAYTQLLSERRAGSVGARLAQLGVEPGRLTTDGEGENAPLATNDTEAGRALNRRVEVALSPMPQEFAAAASATP
jgi:outer membrane protein OmpA-like peptidoglycan-associated protein